MSANVHPLRPVDDSVPAANASKQKFVASELAKVLADAEPYAVGGAQIYVYSGGYYQVGERHLQQRIVEELGQDWTRRRADEITTFLRITSPELWPRPPLEAINVANGLLNLKTRELGPHTPEHLSPVRIAATYDPDARCPAIDAFLRSTLDPDLIPMFEEIVGLVITADNRFQRAIMCIGPGGTGKSTATNLLRALLGSENVSAVALHQLEEDRFATADLYGKLANIFADLDARALRSSSMFKSITGGDQIRGERKHRDSFTFTPYARLIFSANEAPPTADNSDAFFERWLIVPFQHKHRGTDHCDRNLLAKLTTPAELSGLLNRALSGLERLHAQMGFSSAVSSDKAAERFRVDSDSAAGFCEERCDIDLDARVPKPVLFMAYRSWCEANNRRPVAAQRFNRRLRELHAGQLDEVASEGKDYWLGIDLRGDRS